VRSVSGALPIDFRLRPTLLALLALFAHFFCAQTIAIRTSVPTGPMSAHKAHTSPPPGTRPPNPSSSTEDELNFRPAKSLTLDGGQAFSMLTSSQTLPAGRPHISASQPEQQARDPRFSLYQPHNVALPQQLTFFRICSRATRPMTQKPEANATRQTCVQPHRRAQSRKLCRTVPD
jgi:hypothetical protein